MREDLGLYSRTDTNTPSKGFIRTKRSKRQKTYMPSKMQINKRKLRIPSKKMASRRDVKRKQTLQQIPSFSANRSVSTRVSLNAKNKERVEHLMSIFPIW